MPFHVRGGERRRAALGPGWRSAVKVAESDLATDAQTRKQMFPADHHVGVPAGLRLRERGARRPVGDTAARPREADARPVVQDGRSVTGPLRPEEADAEQEHSGRSGHAAPGRRRIGRHLVKRARVPANLRLQPEMAAEVQRNEHVKAPASCPAGFAIVNAIPTPALGEYTWLSAVARQTPRIPSAIPIALMIASQA